MRNDSFKLVSPHSSQLSPVKVQFTRRITMKKISSVLCTAVLALALCPTALAGNIHGIRKADGNIHGVSAYGTITTLVTDAFVAILGNIHG
jgi:hypothetical protein